MSNHHPLQQPISKKFYELGDFEYGGRPALSIKTDLMVMGRYPAEHPTLRGSFFYRRSSLDVSPVNEYVPGLREPQHMGDLIEAMADFQFPSALRRDAQRISSKLVGVFENVSKLHVLRDRLDGRIDSRKLPRLAMATAAGTYDVEQLRPYKRVQPAPVQLPKIAVVADASIQSMWSDPLYVPRSLVLSLGVLWACQAVGLETEAALVQGTSCAMKQYRHVVQGFMLTQPGKTISLKAYGVALHRSLWVNGKIALKYADPSYCQVLAGLDGVSTINVDDAANYLTTRNGGAAVQWARQSLGADVVLAIGDIADGKQADVQVSNRDSMDTAVSKIILALK